MKKLTLSLLAVLVAGTSFAGAPVVTSKEYKQPVVPCFRDQEFALDLFYSFNDAEHQGNRVVNRSNTEVVGDPTFITDELTISQPQYFRDGSGGGVGLNFFFARYFGIGVEGNWWNGVNTGGSATASIGVVRDTDGNITDRGTTRSRSSIRKEAAQQVTGNLILRYPFEGPICWAPYIFAGGGGIWDGSGNGFGDVGLGVEFRVTPNIGIFTDWRWEFMGGHNNNNVNINNVNVTVNTDSKRHNDVNMTRVGVRFVF